MEKLKLSLHNELSMKELEQARHILGMRIERNWTMKTLWLSQSDHIQKVLKCFNLDNVKPARTSLPTTIRLSERDSPSIEEHRKLNEKITFATAIGSIMYAMVVTPRAQYTSSKIQSITRR